MLPSGERLRRKNVFQRAYNERRSISSPQVSLFVIPKLDKGKNNSGNHWKPMVGFVVSKKTSKSACRRNRVKRQTREAYRLMSREIFEGLKDHIKLNRWYALIFVIHPKALTSSFDEIYKSVESSLIRAQKKFGPRKRISKQKSKDDHLVNTREKSSRTGDNS